MKNHRLCENCKFEYHLDLSHHGFDITVQRCRKTGAYLYNGCKDFSIKNNNEISDTVYRRFKSSVRKAFNFLIILFIYGKFNEMTNRRTRR